MEYYLNYCNYIGNFLLALCSVPLAYSAWKNGRINIPFLFLAMWTLGEMLVFIYVMSRGEWALAMNYLANILLLSVVWQYRTNERSE